MVTLLSPNQSPPKTRLKILLRFQPASYRRVDNHLQQPVTLCIDTLGGDFGESIDVRPQPRLRANVYRLAEVAAESIDAEGHWLLQVIVDPTVTGRLEAQKDFEPCFWR